jgi:alkanesulfonate monooxygenase SsuD/methylene tetrahydromethanopterin reductase-like flavin-dependent oxidoreductase (luciferase family)
MSPPQDAAQWAALPPRVYELGYTTLLVPDGLQLLSPLPALALAAGLAPDLCVGTFVLASPLRPARLTAWDAHALSVLTGGRFDFGIGAGLPHTAGQAAELYGTAAPSPAARLAQAEQAIDALRELDGDLHTPVLMAAGGPKARQVAAAKADIVTLAAGPLADRAEVAGTAAELRAAAGPRADGLELAMNIFVVGDQVPAWMERFLGTDAATLIARDSLVMLRGTVRDMADDLQRRRDEFGLSYVIVNGAFADALAPVVELLAGR